MNLFKLVFKGKWYVSESTVNVFLKKTQKEPPVFSKEVVDRDGINGIGWLGEQLLYPMKWSG